MKESYDKHLNVFWNYNGNPHWEDNLTKAFINTLQMSSLEEQIQIINYFINEKDFLDVNEEYQITYDLQNPYLTTDFLISQNCRKILVGFNPNGDIWDENLVEVFKTIEIDKINEKKLTDEIYLKEILGDNYKRDEQDFFIDAIKTRFFRGESRMDGWIFVFKEKNLHLIIGIESKLWKLDPYQLDNHRKKSLGIDTDEKNIYMKFEEVCSFIKSLNPKKYSIQWQYLDYMEKLGYFINSETIAERDLLYVVDNNDYSILHRKWNKYFNAYFSSENYSNLEKKYKLNNKNPLNQKNRINFLENTFVNVYFDIVHDYNKEINDKSPVIFVGSELGVNSNWWNERIGTILDNKGIFSQLKGIYEKEMNSSVSFEVFLRMNSKLQTLYTFCNSFDKLEECFKLKKSIQYKKELNKSECLEEIFKNSHFFKNISEEEFIKKYNESPNDKDNEEETLIKKIKKWNYGSSKSPYNTMSYIRLIDYIPLEVFKENTQEQFNENFQEFLEKHLKGLSVIRNNV